MPRYILDTNVYIHATRDEAWANQLTIFLLAFRPSVYLHSVVAMELLVGAIKSDQARRVQEAFIQPFERRRRIFTPTHAAWKRAAVALVQLVREHRVSPEEGIRRSLVNDCLIAASARDHGFTLVTENTRDFELLSDYLPLQFVAPWPAPT
ncbi:MAG: type II toxin-antitoxin system VapC family toxin [Longimicrobiales bacterium]